ncbi:hypothetical protein [Leptolinea tardivitalis]|uniref:Uncharacterized protein n=1 Tax=Leptolinea tardivitalis TaxID=229920 RepID=A0A0N8GLU2_9CHLR|nr:hypothetical protein [Leptolinea tardivitalis]KPL73450.1 hypothetical protein ADM99_04455 [Leptolinea tardivitalis]GAP21611.1 hypothetical protein LTAR_01822 [Leptolinea tardivitalis]
MNSITDTLTKYSLSWSFLLLFSISLSAPIYERIRHFLTNPVYSDTITTLIIGGILPFGYLINIFPMFFFRISPKLGIFSYAIDKNNVFEKSRIITNELQSQINLFRTRMEKLKKTEDIQKESREFRNEIWTHLNIEYNLITAMLISFFIHMIIGFVSGDWRLGIYKILRFGSNTTPLYFYFSYLLILILIWITTRQNRLLLIETYKIENQELLRSSFEYAVDESFSI